MVVQVAGEGLSGPSHNVGRPPKPQASITDDPRQIAGHSAGASILSYAQSALVILCFAVAAICLHIQQWLGVPLRLIKRSWYDAWQAHVLECTTVLLLGLNQWRAPVTAYISGDSSMKGQIRKQSDGKVVLDLPARGVMMANHQLYTDWLVLWWSTYTAGHHGHLHIVLKAAMRKIPVMGWGLDFFNWVFLSRNWEADRTTLEKSIGRPSHSGKRRPMWLLIFPEGTNLSKRSLALSKRWAEKNDLHYSDLILLPRARGLRAFLQGLASSVDWLYDCTIAYEGLPRDIDGQDIVNLRSLYIQGRRAPLTHAHYRRFVIQDIPLHDPEAFDTWLYERWAEKEQLLEHFRAHDSFPAEDGSVKAQVELRRPLLEMLGVLATCVFAVLVARWAGKVVYVSVAALSYVPFTNVGKI